MTNTVELTPAELEMIVLKREQDELIKKEKELQKQAKIEKKLLEHERIIEGINKTEKEQLHYSQEYKNELGEDWKIKIEYTDKTLNSSIFDEETRNYVIVHSTPYTAQTAKIINGKYVVKVSKESNKRDHIYYMFLSGPDISWMASERAYKKASTINKKIVGLKEIKENKIKLAQKQSSSLQQVVDKMKIEYPGAEISIKKEYERVMYTKKRDYEEYNHLTIVFNNGIKITYKVYSDGSLSRKEIWFGEVKNPWELMSILNKIDLNNK